MNTLSRRDVEFVVLGNSIHNLNLDLSIHPKSAPRSYLLYAAKVAVLFKVTKPYFCFLDGGDDGLPDNFLARCDHMVAEMQARNLVIAYGDEELFGQIQPFGDFNSIQEHNRKNLTGVIHHAPICETVSARNMNWPTGNYWFEGLCYWRLAKLGYFYYPGVHYKWNPTKNGARTWPDTVRGLANTYKYVYGDPNSVVNFYYETEEN